MLQSVTHTIVCNERALQAFTHDCVAFKDRVYYVQPCDFTMDMLTFVKSLVVVSRFSPHARGFVLLPHSGLPQPWAADLCDAGWRLVHVYETATHDLSSDIVVCDLAVPVPSFDRSYGLWQFGGFDKLHAIHHVSVEEAVDADAHGDPGDVMLSAFQHTRPQKTGPTGGSNTPSSGSVQNMDPTANEIELPAVLNSVYAQVSAALTAPPSLRMLFRGYFGLALVTILLDTGATHNFVDSKLAKKLSSTLLSGFDAPVVKLANDSRFVTSGVCRDVVRIQGFKDSTEFISMPLGDHFDVILGNAFMTSHCALIDMAQGRCRLGKHSHARWLQAMPTLPAESNIPWVSVAQFQSDVQHDDMVCRIRYDPITLAAAVGVTTASPIAAPDKFASMEADPELQALMREFETVLPNSMAGNKPQHYNQKHVIPLKEGYKIPNPPLRRLSEPEKAEVAKTIAELLKSGAIVPSTSPFGSSVLLVKKKDGTMRMCMDYRRLNEMTVSNVYPIPNMADLTDCLAGAMWYSLIDLWGAYHQVAISPEDQYKTAFNCHLGHFEFTVLPFGLKNAPATFQTIMNNVFQAALYRFVLVYLDDILVFSKTKEEHLQHLRFVLNVLKVHRFFGKFSKCHFFKTEIPYLGQILTRDGLKPDPSKVAAVTSWPVPNSVKAVRSFLGMANHFSKWLRHLATVVSPISNLLKGKEKWLPDMWTAACQTAFETVKTMLTSAPLLTIHDHKLPTTVICDASKEGMGGVLMQVDKVVAYESKKFAPAETRYPVHDRELLSVVHALKVWRCYLHGKFFTVQTDHNPNTYFASKPVLSERQARWQDTLSLYDFAWEYKKGVDMEADPFSRHPSFELNSVVFQASPALLQECSVAFNKFQPFSQIQPADYALFDVQELDTRPLRCIIERAVARGAVELNVTTRAASKRKATMPAFGTPPTQPKRFVQPWLQQMQDDFEDEHPMVEDIAVGPTDTAISQVQPVPERVEDVVEVHNHFPPPVSQEEVQSTIPTEFLTTLQNGYSLDGNYQLKHFTDQLTLSDGIYYKGHAIAVPNDPTIFAAIMSLLHDAPLAGHIGGRRTLSLVKRQYWWPGMRTYILDYVSRCPKCQMNKCSREKPAGLLNPLPIPIGKWSTVTLDFVTALAPAKGKLKYDAIIVFVDKLTKLVHFAPCFKTCTAADAAELFLNNVVRFHGVPEQIITDRGSQFNNHLWRNLWRLMGVSSLFSTAYHPQTDGQTENMNRTLQDMLRHYVSDKHTDWVKHLCMAEFAVNNAVNASTQQTPFYLTYGRHPRLPGSTARQEPVSDEAYDMVKRMEADLQYATTCLQAAQARQKLYADVHRRPVKPFEVDDLVLLSCKNLKWLKKQGGCKRLKPLFVGPFKVLNRIGEVAYELQLPDTWRVHNVFHRALLKPWHAGGQHPPPVTLTPAGYFEFEVDRILHHSAAKRNARDTKGYYRYLVSWKGLAAEHNVWMDEWNIFGGEEQIQAYWSHRNTLGGDWSLPLL